MKIFMTGATGLIGANTALALLDAGHELRLLVRNVDVAKQYFANKGYQLDDFVIADMRDKLAVAKGMEGCDAVFHAAAMVSVDPKKAQEVHNNNVESIDGVIGAAYRLGIKNIVYVSSNSVYFQPGIDLINERTPIASPKDAYAKSKCDCEAYVRNLQQGGAPIQITYPSGVFGPDDPKLNESNNALRIFLESMLPATSSGMQIVDVRDLARVHKFLLENPPAGHMEEARYVVAGHFFPWRDMHALLERVSGEKIFNPTIPGFVLRVVGVIFDLIKKIYPFSYPISSEAMGIVTRGVPSDSGKVLRTVGMEFRRPEETFFDTIQWLVSAGHLDKKYAKGKLDGAD